MFGSRTSTLNYNPGLERWQGKRGEHLRFFLRKSAQKTTAVCENGCCLTRRLTGRPGHIAPAQNMEVQVEHGLARLLADVGDDAVAVHTQLLRHLGDDLEDVGHHGAVFGGDSSGGSDVGLGNHQEVSRSLRVNVVKGEALLILVDFVGRNVAGNNLAEQTIGHGGTSFVCLVRLLYRILEGLQPKSKDPFETGARVS